MLTSFKISLLERSMGQTRLDGGELGSSVSVSVNFKDSRCDMRTSLSTFTMRVFAVR
jgi:hypothetical protein